MMLANKEKVTVFAAISVMVIVILVSMVILPSRQNSRQLDKKLTRRDADLKETEALQARYRELVSMEKDIQEFLDKREKNFFSPTLWARLAERAKIPKENFKQDIRQPSDANDKFIYEDASAHLELDGISLEQLTKFFYEIEAADRFFKVKNFHLKRSEKKPGILNVDFDVVTQIK